MLFFTVAAEALIEIATRNILSSTSITSIDVSMQIKRVIIHSPHISCFRLLFVHFSWSFCSFKLLNQHNVLDKNTPSIT
jgi:hypothetical protein